MSLVFLENCFYKEKRIAFLSTGATHISLSVETANGSQCNSLSS